MVLGKARRRALATSVEQQAMAVASQWLRSARVERMELAWASGRHWPPSGARTRDVVASAVHERHAANRFSVGRPWR